MNEWRPIPGYSSYECTADGKVRSVARYVQRGKTGNYLKEGKLMTPNQQRGRAYRYLLIGDEGVNTVTAQRITYTAWVGEIPAGYGVTLVDSELPATVDNIKLKWIGFRDHERAIKACGYKHPSELEGFCGLMQSVLSARLSGNPQWSQPWQLL